MCVCVCVCVCVNGVGVVRIVKETKRTYVCIHVCLSVFLSFCLSVCIYKPSASNILLRKKAYIFMHMCVCVCVSLCVRVCARAHVCRCRGALSAEAATCPHKRMIDFFFLEYCIHFESVGVLY